MTGLLEQRANLSGRVAAVLGGGGGIGAAVTLALAQAGLDLIVCDRDAQSLEQTCRAAIDLGRTVHSLALDVTDSAALDAFYDLAEAKFPTLDVVVNIAGGTQRIGFVDATPAMITNDIQRNFGYVIHSVQRAVPLLRRSGRGGSIINFTTIEAHRGAAGFAVYAGAKAATTNFSRALAVELGHERIRVNCVAPDTTPSQGNANGLPPDVLARFAELDGAAMGKGLEMYIPMKTAPLPDALANAVLFLASDLSASVTGMTLHVDGGTMAAAGFIDWPFGDGFVPAPLAGTIGQLFGRKEDLV